MQKKNPKSLQKTILTSHAIATTDPQLGAFKSKTQRQGDSLQLQQFHFERDKLKKKFKLKRMVAAAHSLLREIRNSCETEDVSQPDSSWELCTLMTQARGISIGTAGCCIMREAIFKVALGGFVSGQGLCKRSQILAADGSIVEVARPPEASEKRGKLVQRMEKTKLEVTVDHRVLSVTHAGAQTVSCLQAERNVGELTIRLKV